jgi:serine/threonine protein kinase
VKNIEKIKMVNIGRLNDLIPTGMNNIKERPEFEHYTKIKLLGEGSFGKAFLVTRNSDKLQCVMK